MGKDSLDLLRGTVDVLILKALSWGPQHGYAIARWIRQRTDDDMLIEEGALYPALYRLEGHELIEASLVLEPVGQPAPEREACLEGQRRRRERQEHRE